MFHHANKPRFPNLPVSAAFFTNSQDPTETDYAKLVTLMNESMQNGDPDKAQRIASRIALYYGVPGLIHYVNNSIVIMRKELEQGEEIQQMGFNTLVYLNLAKELWTNNADAKHLMTSLMPEQSISDNYWNSQKALLVELASLEGLDIKAADSGRSLFNNSLK